MARLEDASALARRTSAPAEDPRSGAASRELLDYEIRVSEDANGRYGAFWRCRFWSYEERGGMRVPLDGEAAWLPPEGKKSYFRGRITEIVYEFPR